MEKKTPTEWLNEWDFCDIQVLDADGWDRSSVEAFDSDWNKPITKKAMHYKISLSTIKKVWDSECTNCKSASFFGGSAMSTYKCKDCGKGYSFGNTNTPIRCVKCSIYNNKCERCESYLFK